jgi:hypothetical protein
MFIDPEDTRLFAGFPADHWESDDNPFLILPYDEHGEALVKFYLMEREPTTTLH